MIATNTKERFVELRADNLSYDAIAKQLGVSKPTLMQWGRELELEIANMRSIQLEALQEKYFVGKRHRIELYGTQLKAIREELANRSFSDVPTAKLVEIMTKLTEGLKAEEVNVSFTQEEDGIALQALRTRTTWSG